MEFSQKISQLLIFDAFSLKKSQSATIYQSDHISKGRALIENQNLKTSMKVYENFASMESWWISNTNPKLSESMQSITEGGIQHGRYLETWYLEAGRDLGTSEADTEVGVL